MFISEGQVDIEVKAVDGYCGSLNSNRITRDLLFQNNNSKA